MFVCVNTQRRAQARNLAAEYEARRRVGTLDSVRTDEDMKSKAAEEVKEAKDRLDRAIRAAYQHIIYLDERQRWEPGRGDHPSRWRQRDRSPR